MEGLRPGREYAVRVRAGNVRGQGAWSGPAFGTTLPAVPGPPPMPAFSQRSSTAVRVRWQLPEEDNGAPVTSYRCALLMVKDRVAIPELCSCLRGMASIWRLRLKVKCQAGHLYIAQWVLFAHIALWVATRHVAQMERERSSHGGYADCFTLKTVAGKLHTWGMLAASMRNTISAYVGQDHTRLSKDNAGCGVGVLALRPVVKTSCQALSRTSGLYAWQHVSGG